MRYIKKYESKKYKIGDYVKWGNSDKIFRIIQIKKNKYKPICIKEQTGTIYGGVYWINDDELLPATEIEINTLKYNL